MQIMSVLMPGLRDLRAPFASGILWTALLCLVYWEQAQNAASMYGELVSVLPFSSKYSDVVAAGILTILVYIFGVLAMTASHWVILVATALVRRLVHWSRRRARGPYFGNRFARAFFRSYGLRSRFHPIPQESVENARATLVRTLPRSIAERFPIPAVLWDSAASEQQLATTHPEQHQWIDRSRAESEFKIAVAGPLVLCFFILLSRAELKLIAVVPMAAALVLLFLALEDIRKANRLLWTAVYLGYAVPPVLSSAASKLAAIDDADGLNLDTWLEDHLRDTGVAWQIRQDFSAQAW